MSRLVKMILVGALLLSSVGCVLTSPAPQQTIGGYPYRYNRSDFKVGWNTGQSKEGLKVEMGLKSVQYSLVTDLWVEVSLKQGEKITAQKKVRLLGDLKDDASAEFNFMLKGVSASEGDQLKVRLTYNATEGGAVRALDAEFAVDPVTGEIYQ